MKLKTQTPQAGKRASPLITNSVLIFSVLGCEIFPQTEQHLVPTATTSSAVTGFSTAKVPALPSARGTSVPSSSAEAIHEKQGSARNST